MVTQAAAVRSPHRGCETEAFLGDPPTCTPTRSRPGGGTGAVRVLIIEDNKDVAGTLQMFLDLLGYDARVAYDGETGVRLATAWPPDAIVCDIGLPGLSGYEVARALRADPATAHARLIAVTAYGSDQDRRRAAASGFAVHLTKPADPEALLLALPQATR